MRNLKELNLLKTRFLAAHRNDTQRHCDTVSYAGCPDAKSGRRWI